MRPGREGIALQFHIQFFEFFIERSAAAGQIPEVNRVGQIEDNEVECFRGIAVAVRQLIPVACRVAQEDFGR